MNDPTLQEIANKHNKTPGQVLIRWSLQHGYVCLVKTVNPARMAENKEVFDFALDDDDMAKLDGLDQYFVTGWDPIKNDPV